MMDNYAESTKLATEATQANGLANEKNDVYLTSVEAKMTVLSSTVKAMWQNMIDSDILKGTIDGLTTLLNTFGNLPSMITLVVTSLAVFKGSLISLKISSAVSQMIAYQMALGATTTASAVMAGATSALIYPLKALQLAMATNPIGLFAVAIATVVGGLMIYKNHLKEAKKATEELFTATQNTAKSYNEATTLLSKIKSLEKQANDTSDTEKATQAKKDLTETMKQMATLLPTTTSGFTDEGDAIANNNSLIKEQLELKREEMVLNSQKFMEDNKNLVNISEKYAQAKKDVEALKIAQAQGKTTTPIETKRIVRGQQVTSVVDTNINDALSEKNKFMQESIEAINKYNVYADILNKNTGSNIQAITLETKVIKDNTDAKNSNANAIYEQVTSMEDLVKTFDTSIDSISSYNKLMDDYNKNGKFSAESVKDIIDNHQELAGYLNNEPLLYKKIGEALSEQKDVANKTYADMMSSSEEYYSSNIKGTNVIKNALGDYWKTLTEGQKNELENAKTLAEAKMIVEKELISRMAKAWDAYNQALGNILTSHANLAKGMESGDTTSDLMLEKIASHNTIAKNALKDAKSIQSELNAVNTSFDGITSGIKAPSVLGSTGSLSSKDKDPKSSTSEALKTNPFDILINSQNALLEDQNDLIDTTKSNIKSLLDIGSDNSYSKALSEQNSLYSEQVDKINLLKENIASVSGKNGINGLENALKSNYSALKNKDISKMSEDDLKVLGEKLFPTKTFTGDNADKDSKKYEAGRQTFLDYVDNLTKMREAKETYNKDILASEIELSNIVKETYEQRFANNDRLLSKYEDEVKKSNNDISLLGNIDTPEEEQSQLKFIETRKSARVNELNAVNSEMDKLNGELKTIDSTTDEGQLRIKSINDRLKELGEKQIDVKINITADEDSMKSTIKSQVQSLLEAEKAISEQSLENEKTIKFTKYDDDLKAFTKLQRDKIDLIDAELLELDKTNQAEDERAERIKRQNDLIEIQTQLTNVKAEKNIKAFTGDKFEWVADQTKVDELTKQANDKQIDNNKWENDLATKHLKEQKEIEKKAYQDSISDKEKYYTDLKESDNKYYANEKFLLDQHYLDMDTLVATYMDTLKLTYGSKWDEILLMLDGKLSEATAKQNALLAIQNQLQNGVPMTTQASSNLSVLNDPNNQSKMEQARDNNPTTFFDLLNKMNTTTGAEQSKAIADMKKLTGLATGGMTKNWSDGDSTNGKAVIMHPEEIVNNPIDSKFLLKTMDTAKNIMMNLIPNIKQPDFSKFNFASANGTGNVENHYSFGDLSFPNMRDGDGVSTFINELDNIKFIKPR